MRRKITESKLFFHKSVNKLKNINFGKKIIYNNIN